MMNPFLSEGAINTLIGNTTAPIKSIRSQYSICSNHEKGALYALSIKEELRFIPALWRWRAGPTSTCIGELQTY